MLLCKQGWRVLENPSSLVALVLEAKYFSHSNFLNANLGSNPSYFWRSILLARPLLKRDLRWQIENGESVSAVNDPWIPRSASFKLLPFNCSIPLRLI